MRRARRSPRSPSPARAARSPSARPPAAPTARASSSATRGGDVVAEAALPADGRFALAYRHSVYKAPAEERFRALADGRLRARERRLAEPAGARVLRGSRGRIARGRLVPARRPARFTTMALAATERGRRTLVVGGERDPAVRRTRVHLRIAVEGT